MKDLWRENLRQLFLDFIDLGEDEEAWKINLGIYDDLLAEVKRFEQVKKWVYNHKKYPTITKIHLKDLMYVIEGEEE
jgi:hypothetical protein|tara:strand:+ start:2515 stop:2745 length:231 start_codon:yes stop_codon:yes gene_type:complete